MRSFIDSILRVVVIATGLLLASCGGGGDFLASFPGTSVNSSGISMGVISGFGSVRLNGQVLDVTGAAISVNGESATEADLKAGQLVRAVVDFRDDTASELVYVDTVRGPVASINRNNNTLDVLGQVVVINTRTSFDGISFEELVVNDIVEVSGFRNSGGSILANYVALGNGTDDYRVLGIASASGTGSFRISGLQVDSATATLINLASSGVTNGDLVEVVGAAADYDSGTTTLVASVLRAGVELGGTEDDQVELEGAITSFISTTDFIVADQQVDSTSATTIVFENGGTASGNDLGINVVVEVEGTIDVDGDLQATRVVVKSANEIRVIGTVDDIDNGDESVELLGFTFDITNLTRMSDQSITALKPFALSDINTGDSLELRGFESGNNITASLLERDDDRNDALLRARVEAIDVSGFSITLLGTELQTTLATDFEDANGNSITRSEFFENLVQVNDEVQAQWDNFSSINSPLDKLVLD